MDDLPSADVDSYMVNITSAGIEQKISGLNLAYINLFPSACLISGTAPCTDSKMGEYAHNKSGAVRAVRQAGSTVLVRISQKLFRISYHSISGGRIH